MIRTPQTKIVQMQNPRSSARPSNRRLIRPQDTRQRTAVPTPPERKVTFRVNFPAAETSTHRSVAFDDRHTRTRGVHAVLLSSAVPDIRRSRRGRPRGVHQRLLRHSPGPLRRRSHSQDPRLMSMRAADRNDRLLVGLHSTGQKRPASRGSFSVTSTQPGKLTPKKKHSPPTRYYRSCRIAIDSPDRPIPTASPLHRMQGTAADRTPQMPLPSPP